MENYQNILYKKKAIENLSTLLCQTEAKKVLFLASKTAYQNFGANVTNQLAVAECEFELKLLPSECNQEIVEDAVKSGKDCGFVIALGGASVCDTAKLCATKMDVAFVLIPSLPSSFGYFSNFAFCKINNVYKKIYTNQAYKILVDENIICKASEKQVINGQKFVLSMFECLFSCQFDNLYFGQKKDISALKLQLCKFKDNYEYLQSGTDDSKLVLMDILIELAKATDEIADINVFDFAFCMKSKTDMSFGALCLLSSKILAGIYKQIFEFKKLYQFSLPNFEKIDKNLCSMQIKSENVNFGNIKKMTDNLVYKKINLIKNQCLTLCENFENQINNYFLPSEKGKLHVDVVCKVFNIVPVLYQCSPIVNMIYGMGLMNIG